jgi:acyl-coenzyme A synthetase/AMP-(fatty) acid ligase/acyl carrier protein
VPLDADHPIDRNARIVLHAAAAAIVSAGEDAGSAAALLPGLPLVDLDRLGAAGADRPARPGPGDLAWITYTSGSTGQPKGVFQDHRGLLRDVAESIETLGLGPHDNTAMFNAPSLLQGTRIALGGLLAGASVHALAPKALTPAGVAREIQARGITVFRSVPALFARVAEAAPPGGLDSLRLVYLGGDRVGWNDYGLFRRVCRPDAAFGTHLGSTECSTVYLHWLVEGGLRAAGGQMPVGRLLPGRRLRLLDEEGAEVPDGETGEFVVSGNHLARGYWRDPGLTSRAFGVDAEHPGLRTYRTGDLGRRRLDGLYEFVGRRDRQVKLRGHRIEPGEIEGALRGLGGVRDAAVVIRRSEAGVPRAAVAYVELGADGKGMQTRHLAAMAGRVLPVHMVPASFFIEAELPRLANLKLDRARLEELDVARSAEQAAGLDADPLADEVVRIFEAALGVKGATREDNFASLGGDSFSAVAVAASLEERFAVPIPADLFDRVETIAELARWIERQQGGNG